MWCVWVFAAVGSGIPGPWDAPRRFAAAGPYRWVRNPIYIAALLVVSGEAWLSDLLPFARDRLPSAAAAPPLRRRLRRVRADGPTLDPAPAAAQLSPAYSRSAI